MTSQSTHVTKPLNILSLDGGGIRGLSSLLILETIMLESNLTPRRNPCDVFDLICGTSTGGLIALMLGRLRMSVEQCIHAYTDLSKDIFGKRNPLSGANKIFGKSVYDHNKLEKKIKEIVEKYGDGATTMQDPRGDRCCRTFVLAANPYHADSSPRLFRTYRHSGRVVPLDDCQIWEAARATSAASTFFNSITIGKPGEVFIDGAIGKHNNPSFMAMHEASTLWSQRPIGLHLSLGTGTQARTKFTGNGWAMLRACQNLVTSCEDMHQVVYACYHMLRFNNPPDPYCRFSVSQGLEDVGLADYKKLTQVTTITRTYMKHYDRRRDLYKVRQELTARAMELAREQTSEEEATETPEQAVEKAQMTTEGLVATVEGSASNTGDSTATDGSATVREQEIEAT